MPCPVCGGRVIKAESGKRCMDPSCEGAKGAGEDNQTQCRCGETMIYQGLNTYGEPQYKCPACGNTLKL